MNNCEYVYNVLVKVRFSHGYVTPKGNWERRFRETPMKKMRDNGEMGMPWVLYEVSISYGRSWASTQSLKVFANYCSEVHFCRPSPASHGYNPSFSFTKLMKPSKRVDTSFVRSVFCLVPLHHLSPSTCSVQDLASDSLLSIRVSRFLLTIAAFMLPLLVSFCLFVDISKANQTAKSQQIRHPGTEAVSQVRTGGKSRRRSRSGVQNGLCD